MSEDSATIYLVVGRGGEGGSWYPVRWRTSFEDAFELVWALYEQAFELNERLKPYRAARWQAWLDRWAAPIAGDCGRLKPDPDGALYARFAALERDEKRAGERFAEQLIDREWAAFHYELDLDNLVFGDFSTDSAGVYIDGFAYAIWEVTG